MVLIFDGTALWNLQVSEMNTIKESDKITTRARHTHNIIV